MIPFFICHLHVCIHFTSIGQDGPVYGKLAEVKSLPGEVPGVLPRLLLLLLLLATLQEPEARQGDLAAHASARQESLLSLGNFEAKSILTKTLQETAMLTQQGREKALGRRYQRLSTQRGESSSAGWWTQDTAGKRPTQKDL